MKFYFGDFVDGWNLWGIHIGRVFLGLSIEYQNAIQQAAPLLADLVDNIERERQDKS